ncbi:MAG: RidA family protein, partial [Betaproteobacteria bacterium]
LQEGQARPEHIVRMTWYVLDRKAYMQAWPEIGRLFREIIGSYNAAMTAVEVSGLMEEQAQVEIEVTALVPDQG